MTRRLIPSVPLWVSAVLITAWLAPTVQAAGPAGGERSKLPPVVELGEASGSAVASAPAAREVLTDLLQQLETLQSEVRNLRGQVEVQANEIERLKSRQRELLADIDKRVHDLEQRNGPAATTAAPETTSAPASATSVTPQEQQDYDAAINFLKKGNYDRATKGFRDFMTKYPQSMLRDNAQYWLAETYYVMRNFRQAREEFAKVIKENPKTPKAADVLLKIGYSHYELSEWSKARANLSQVVSLYPGTGAAKSAEQRLAKMKKEGH